MMSLKYAIYGPVVFSALVALYLNFVPLENVGYRLNNIMPICFLMNAFILRRLVNDIKK